MPFLHLHHPPFITFHHHFYRWYGYHSQSWVVYGIVLPTLPCFQAKGLKLQTVRTSPPESCKALDRSSFSSQLLPLFTTTWKKIRKWYGFKLDTPTFRWSTHFWLIPTSQNQLAPSALSGDCLGCQDLHFACATEAGSATWRQAIFGLPNFETTSIFGSWSSKNVRHYDQQDTVGCHEFWDVLERQYFGRC